MPKQETPTYRLETLAVHAGQAPDPTTGSRQVPIYQTTAYQFASTEHAARMFALDEPGNIYSRIGNPTVDVLEKRVAALEGGVAGVAFASGHAAIAATIMNLAHAGDEIVSSSQIYGGAYNMFAVTLPKYGIRVRFVDPADPENFRQAITPATRAIFAEIIGNPSLGVLDVEAVARIAHEAGIPLIVDNTFATPALCRPIEWGADIVVHSATKWLSGHGTSLAGVVVDSGRFDWKNPKFPGFTTPDPSYHDIVYADEFGSLAFATKLRVQLLRDMGACLSPFNAYLTLLGIETLHLRMRAHCENAVRVAEFLKDHPGVAWVNYPGLPDHPSYDLVRRYFDGGMGGSMITFGIRGGVEAGARFIDALALWSHVANVGDARSLVIHPASTTHSQLSPEDRARAGVPDDLIRLSVGIENPDDLLADLDRALAAATGHGRLTAPGGRSRVINDEAVIRWVLDSPYVTETGPDGETRTRPKVLAVVGASSDPGRPSNRVSRKMQRLGFRIVPVNPRETEVLGEKAYPDLKSIPFPVDVVQVFRRPDAALEAAREAAEIGARVLWLQEGVVNDEAAAYALQRGLEVVHNRCTYKEAQRLKGSIVTFKPV
ncbi:PLP-dependent aspartate aminotransferase family protein [Caldinitratiruptor microaerophilus]|uniref:O-succinylhomoserine sulfhydrylase n=1 Tax=Caldinitratiruptor microaerophilus TaxID=671077 RepID=A0AA35CKI6_9FIRM|nr:PLP-dependent aspartate aminotransferase family protein [Caldinitratiruptor microaerophilus]BDG60902.1 hypothetical protein caldi_19920 [Caldinitratiruptor microaerophilus]